MIKNFCIKKYSIVKLSHLAAPSLVGTSPHICQNSYGQKSRSSFNINMNK